MQVELNKKDVNPFSGLSKCLALYSNASKGEVNTTQLDLAWDEVKDSKEKREMFFSLLFSIGDITGREHNIFKGNKVDSGGNSQRDAFFICMNWMKEKLPHQFAKFLNAHLFNEYTCFDNLFKNRIQTKGKAVVKCTYAFTDQVYNELLLDFVVSIIKGNNPFDKMLVAKFLTLPRLTHRKGHKRMLPQTLKAMSEKAQFLERLSEKMNWEYHLDTTVANFKGYREWRKQYNSDLESVLFSTGKINEFDQEEFLNWLNRIPSQARFRVRNRIMFEKDGKFKYPKLKEWYEIWEKYKEEKQQEQRVLEEKVRQGTAKEEDKVKLKEVKKEAKVTVGATNFKELYDQICTGKVDKLKLESFMDKVNLPYNSLVIIDDSGSMSGAPYEFAAFMAAVCLAKNPDDNGRNLLGFFNNTSRLYGYMDKTVNPKANSLMKSSITKTTPKSFIDPNLSFYDNYQNISKFCKAVFQSGGTSICSIPRGFDAMVKNDPMIMDDLRNYPIWTIISDGEWNNLYSPEASLNQFFRECENLLGFRPFIIAIDIRNNSWYSSVYRSVRFTGIDNFIYIPSNPAQIEQILTNFKDIDTFDIYTPLQSLYRSNRYSIVRGNVI